MEMLGISKERFEEITIAVKNSFADEKVHYLF
jgi:hypothetical protein